MLSFCQIMKISKVITFSFLSELSENFDVKVNVEFGSLNPSDETLMLSILIVAMPFYYKPPHILLGHGCNKYSLNEK